MGYPATGQLQEQERVFLVSSYHRAQSGGAATQQLISQFNGTQGLLAAYRDEAAGNTTLAATETKPAIEPIIETVEEPSGVLPNLTAFDTPTETSLASFCNQVGLVTGSNGGFSTLVSMSDAQFTLGEQFCLARTYAISAGEELTANLQGISAAQVETQCQAFGPATAQYVASLPVKPHTEVMADVSQFILTTGMSPMQLAGTSKICLSVGYRTDNMEVAVGSALLLTVLGEQPYAELLGHHLLNGFGVAPQPEHALAWFETSIEALMAGSDAVFVPGQIERTDLLRAALSQHFGDAFDTVVPASLPSFGTGTQGGKTQN